MNFLRLLCVLVYLSLCLCITNAQAVNEENIHNNWCQFSGTGYGYFDTFQEPTELCRAAANGRTSCTESGLCYDTTGQVTYNSSPLGYAGLDYVQSYSPEWVYEWPPGSGTYYYGHWVGAGRYVCLDGYAWHNSDHTCKLKSCLQGEVWDAKTEAGGVSPKNPPKTCQSTPNPISIVTGNKYKSQIDWQSGSLFSVKFERVYSSKNLYWQGAELGSAWRHNYSNAIQGLAGTFDLGEVYVIRPDGQRLTFTLQNGVWASDQDVVTSLEPVNDLQGKLTGWVYTTQINDTETYDELGRIQSIQSLSGQSQTLHYNVSVVQGGDDNPDTLDQVTDSYGNSLTFNYDANNRIIQMTDPKGGVYRYAYDANGMLQYVSYPDNPPGTSGANPFGEDNPYRTYHYEDANFPTALTGITDETGNRYATYTYDTQGRAISSELADGNDRVMLDYTHIDDATDPRVTVTNELGKDTTYHYTTLHGVRKVTQVEGHPTANCVGANKHYTYDANGFLDTVTDWEGNITDYDHDSRGLEIKRVEAVGTPQQRTILTEWETSYRLPKKITEPERVIDFSYDANGQLLERKETPVGP